MLFLKPKCAYLDETGKCACPVDQRGHDMRIGGGGGGVCSRLEPGRCEGRGLSVGAERDSTALATRRRASRARP